eukprot:CAMPEP_0171079026 /NCGR_PEP_ID=MMETSP0766_2-20121228/14999_1 /TAXON_ID=439317 /ORGANISM="Gambierdiscus australes, Strain CAWD 149" /LENGTH=116 /DNA_ID=CAMNT_0011536189 /DNA_START=35 /DNA_END=382 /DNA_ORIENTATION=-
MVGWQRLRRPAKGGHEDEDEEEEEDAFASASQSSSQSHEGGPQHGARPAGKPQSRKREAHKRAHGVRSSASGTRGTAVSGGRVAQAVPQKPGHSRTAGHATMRREERGERKAREAR